jgi:hypothetical protein
VDRISLRQLRRRDQCVGVEVRLRQGTTVEQDGGIRFRDVRCAGVIVRVHRYGFKTGVVSATDDSPSYFSSVGDQDSP